MKVLVVYDTVSPGKLTGQLAETIANTLKANGVDVDPFYVKDVDIAAVKNCDCLIVGAPTMAFRPSMEITKFLNILAEGGFSGKQAAAFDTQIQMAISGNAAKGIEKRLKNLGFTIIKEPLVVYVKGEGKNVWQFKPGELEKAKTWALEVARKLS